MFLFKTNIHIKKAMNIPKNDNRQPEEEKDHAEKEETPVEERERKIDEQLEQSFPASDPPSYSRPGNDSAED